MATTAAKSIYDFEAESIAGKPAQLATQRGKVLLIVNTASKCGFTPQFAGLEELWRTTATRASSWSASRATSSAPRTRARTTRSPRSASSTTASAFR